MDHGSLPAQGHVYDPSDSAQAPRAFPRGIKDYPGGMGKQFRIPLRSIVEIRLIE